MAASDHLSARQFPAEYVKHYSRGYSASRRAMDSMSDESPLERADMRGEPDSWYDGYHDEAAGRDKFETALYRHDPEGYKSRYGMEHPFDTAR